MPDLAVPRIDVLQIFPQHRHGLVLLVTGLVHGGEREIGRFE